MPADPTTAAKIETALRELEEKFTKAFRASPDAIAITDLETGVFIETNGSYERIFGAPGSTFIGKSTLEMNFYRDPADRARMVEQIRAHGSVRNIELQCYNQRREPIVVLYSGEAIELNGRKCLLSVIHDITARKLTEQALRESEQKFLGVFREAPVWIVISDAATSVVLEVNDAALQAAGHRREEVVGHTAAELGWIQAADRERLVRQVREQGRAVNFEMMFRTKDGRELCGLVSSGPIDIGGRACTLSVTIDITARRQAEAALRHSEDKFAMVFRTSPEAISVHELASSRYLDVNPGFERLFGYAREEAIGRTPLELGVWVESAEREAFLAHLQRDGLVRDYQARFRLRNGEVRLCELSSEVVEIGGRPHNVSVLRDITERKRAEQALRDSEEKFAKAFRASPHPLIISELATGRFLDVNRGFERITGYSREEVIGRSGVEINAWVNPEDREELMSRLQRDGMVRDMELRFRRKYGGILITRGSFETIELAGRPCMLSSIEDITEQRQAEEQKAALEAQLRQNQKLEALGTLAGGIAHDFNNILTAIIVNQELGLMDATEPEAVRQRLAEIGRASNRAKELVRQILTFSRQQQHERLKQNLQPIILEALGLLRASLPATIVMEQDISSEAPPVLADASQIHQVIMNLGTNSAHAMRHQPGRLTVQLMARSLDAAACLALPGLQPGRYAQLTVADTGHGMDAAVLARIFEPFFTTKGPGEGTGLGLPMVHGIMQDHDGGIFVQSFPDTGTTFNLYFPEATENGVPQAVIDTDIVPGRGESVLVVDDEEAICAAVGATLRKIGYRVQAFTEPLLALEHIKDNPAAYDLLLTDRTMPQLSGPELIARVREGRPDLPVLLMSGLDSPPEMDEDGQGVFRLVAKPIDIAELSRSVRQALLTKPTR